MSTVALNRGTRGSSGSTLAGAFFGNRRAAAVLRLRGPVRTRRRVWAFLEQCRRRFRGGRPCPKLERRSERRLRGNQEQRSRTGQRRAKRGVARALWARSASHATGALQHRSLVRLQRELHRHLGSSVFDIWVIAERTGDLAGIQPTGNPEPCCIGMALHGVSINSRAHAGCVPFGAPRAMMCGRSATTPWSCISMAPLGRQSICPPLPLLLPAFLEAARATYGSSASAKPSSISMAALGLPSCTSAEPPGAFGPHKALVRSKARGGEMRWM